ncbi:hypothetical protein AAK899_12455 [Erysipelotrichaceae bacterium 51-3]
MKKYSRFATAALASAMTFSAMGMAVLATEPTPVDGSDTSGSESTAITIPITKNVKVRSENAPMPATTFNFTIDNTVASGTEITITNKDSSGNATTTTQPVLGGPKGGLVETTSITFTPGETLTPPTTTHDGDTTIFTYTGATTLTVDRTKFENLAPGIYRYKITENSGDYDGMEYDTQTTYYVDVYKTNDGVEAAIASKDGNPENKTDVVFNNDFSDPTGDNGTREVTLTKKVEGNQGEKGKQFAFTFKVVGTDGEVYNYQKFTKDQNGKDVAGELKQITQGVNVATETLADGEYIKIYGVSPNDTVYTDETVKGDNGYTTTVDAEGGTLADPEEGAKDKDTIIGNLKQGEKLEADPTITWTNYKQVDTPTGILLTAAPYAAVVALGGVFAGLFFRRKRED